MPWPTLDLLLPQGPLSKEKVPPFPSKPALLFSSALQYYSIVQLCAFSCLSFLFGAPNIRADSVQVYFQAAQFKIS